MHLIRKFWKDASLRLFWSTPGSAVPKAVTPKLNALVKKLSIGPRLLLLDLYDKQGREEESEALWHRIRDILLLATFLKNNLDLARGQPIPRVGLLMDLGKEPRRSRFMSGLAVRRFAGPCCCARLVLSQSCQETARSKCSIIFMSHPKPWSPLALCCLSGHCS